MASLLLRELAAVGNENGRKAGVGLTSWRTKSLRNLLVSEIKALVIRKRYAQKAQKRTSLLLDS